MLVNWTQYLAARAVASFVQCFPLSENLATAARIGSWLYRSNRQRRERAIGNVARCFPEWSAARADETAERSYQHMVQLFLVDAFVAPRLLSPSGWPNYASLHELAPAIRGFLRHEPAMLITGHFGNWELLANLLASFGFPIHALARPIDNPLINDWVMGMREARGTRIITKWGATPIVQEAIAAGGRVAFIADQNAGDQGFFVPFFDRFASTYKSIGLLALRYETPIHVGYARRINGEFRYDVALIDTITPDDWTDQPDPLFYITARFNRAMETMIRLAPEQYLWVHRRWKSRPKHEREGKPIPSPLLRKLESLPWMTDAALERLIENSKRDAREATSAS